MSPPASTSPASERRNRAFLRLLADVCRYLPDLREWLVEDFARDTKTRESFLKLVENGDMPGDDLADGFAGLAGELSGWAEEKRRLQAQWPAHAIRPFGGLTWDEMESLVRRYEARTLPLHVFLLARDWRKAGKAAKASPRLLCAGVEFLDAAIRSGDKRALAQLGSAVDLLAGFQPKRLRTTFGYADWWKLHALVYMLRHPREAYRTREVRAHLATLGLRISTLDFSPLLQTSRHPPRRTSRSSAHTPARARCALTLWGWGRRPHIGSPATGAGRAVAKRRRERRAEVRRLQPSQAHSTNSPFTSKEPTCESPTEPIAQSALERAQPPRNNCRRRHKADHETDRRARDKLRCYENASRGLFR